MFPDSTYFFTNMQFDHNVEYAKLFQWPKGDFGKTDLLNTIVNKLSEVAFEFFTNFIIFSCTFDSTKGDFSTIVSKSSKTLKSCCLKFPYAKAKRK